MRQCLDKMAICGEGQGVEKGWPGTEVRERMGGVGLHRLLELRGAEDTLHTPSLPYGGREALFTAPGWM